MRDTPDTTRQAEKRRTILLVAVILVGMAAVVGLGRWHDAHPAVALDAYAEDDLYVKGSTAKNFSLGFNGLMADWYWLRSLQYVGRKMLNYQGDDVRLDDLSPLNLKLLPQMLDNTVALDPQFTAAYDFGAMVLPAVDYDKAIKFLEQGIAANPDNWRLRHHLGYIFWQHGDYARAAATYGAGAQLPNAPGWMRVMSARMQQEGGSRATAREMYRRLYEESSDASVKELAAGRLVQLASLDERDALMRVLQQFQTRFNRCPAAWREIAPVLRTLGFRLDAASLAPLDPTNVPYQLKTEGCAVELGKDSKIPRK